MQANSDIAQPLDFTAKRRDTFEYNLNWTDSTGANFQFTTHTAKMDVRTAPASEGGTLIVSLSSPTEILLSSGRMQLIKDFASMEIEPGEYFHDIQVTYPNGKVKTWATGAFTVTDDVTT